MDAITSKAIETLESEVLNQLKIKLAEILKIPANNRECSQELSNLIIETRNLLNIVSTWSGGDELEDLDLGVTSVSTDDLEVSEDEAAEILKRIEAEERGELPTTTSSEMSNDEAKQLLAEANSEGKTHIQDPDINEIPDDEAAAMLTQMNESTETDSDEMSDDEAAAMLAQMDNSETGESDEMNDDEAAALLAQMDGPAASESDEMSDDEAAAMLAQMDGPATSESDEMSDDDAAAMLAQMDAPTTSESDEMSDDDAAAMLAQMDAPASNDASDMSDDEAAAMLAQMDAPTEDDNTNADDEAAAMLAALERGASEASLQPQKQAEQTETDLAQQGQAGGEFGGVEEIQEWEPNDFQDDPDMKADFIQNVDELMETLDDTILKLEDNPNDKEVIEEIFRAAHTLKGAAGMFGYRGMERVMHRMENLFDLIRKDKMTPDAGIIDVVFAGMDVIRDLIEAVRKGAPSGTKTAHIVHALELVADGKSASHITGKAKKSEDTSNNASPSTKSPNETDAGGGDAKPSKQKTVASSTIRVDLNRLDALVNLVGELVIDRTRFATIEEDLRTNHPQVGVTGKLSDTLQMFGRHMNEIQDIIMKVRMVPIGNAFNKYPRIIRDLARTLGKEIDLFIDGENTELDKTLVEQIGDPLVHLIRNACDHGVEMPDDRLAAGKKKKGKVFLSARQEGNLIIIEIEDDGKGMNPDIIRQKAIEKGLITEDDKLSNREIFGLIFEPGFSTAEQVTTVSGRGVGMDVVKKQIAKLKGTIDIDSTMGKGSKITIQLPLTLAIVQSLLVNSKDEIFAIPLSTVVESIRVSPNEIQKVGQQEVIKLRNKILPLIHLDEALELKNKAEHLWYNHENDTPKKTAIKRRTDRLFIVVVGAGEKRFGIVVDQLMNQQEMVIKPMGKVVANVNGVAGGAVLGNGEVVLVLDIPELENKYKSTARNQVA